MKRFKKIIPYVVKGIMIVAVILGLCILIDIVQGKQNKDDWETPMIHKAYFEGHSYLIYKRDGICHDENCKCKK